MVEEETRRGRRGKEWRVWDIKVARSIGQGGGVRARTVSSRDQTV